MDVSEALTRIGTSGFSYAEWKGIFYPRDLPADQYLAFYGQTFPTTEINNTFYRMPSAQVTSRWAEQVPSHFRFTLKLNQRITHKKRLQGVEEEMRWFFQGAQALGERLGCLLVQLPPWSRQDLASLGTFLSHYREAPRLAFEFRHPSWFAEETFQLLAEYGAALVLADTDEEPSRRLLTADFVYLRLRRSHYSPEQLQDWANWLKEQGRPSYVYFKHEGRAPELARHLQQMMSS